MTYAVLEAKLAFPIGSFNEEKEKPAEEEQTLSQGQSQPVLDKTESRSSLRT